MSGKKGYKLLITKLYYLKNYQGFIKYFTNISWFFAEKILRMVVGHFVGIWVARYLGPEKFGLLSYDQSFVGLFSAIATLGLIGILKTKKRPIDVLKHEYKDQSFFMYGLTYINTVLLHFYKKIDN